MPHPEMDKYAPRQLRACKPATGWFWHCATLPNPPLSCLGHCHRCRARRSTPACTQQAIRTGGAPRGQLGRDVAQRPAVPLPGIRPTSTSRYRAPAGQRYQWTHGGGAHPGGIRALTRQIAERTVQREYWALAHGHWKMGSRQTVSVDKPVGRDVHNRLRMAVVNLDRHPGKEARTDFTLIDNSQAQVTPAFGCIANCTQAGHIRSGCTCSIWAIPSYLIAYMAALQPLGCNARRCTPFACDCNTPSRDRRYNLRHPRRLTCRLPCLLWACRWLGQKPFHDASLVQSLVMTPSAPQRPSAH